MKKILLVNAAAAALVLLFWSAMSAPTDTNTLDPAMAQMAYLHASLAYMEQYPWRSVGDPRMSTETIGAYTPGRVTRNPDGSYSVRVTYRGEDFHGRPMAEVTDPSTLRYEQGLWVVVHLAPIERWESHP